MYKIKEEIAALELLKKEVTSMHDDAFGKKKILESKLKAVRMQVDNLNKQANYCNKFPNDLKQKEKFNNDVNSLCKELGIMWEIFQSFNFETDQSEYYKGSSFDKNKLRKLQVQYHDSFARREKVPKIIIKGKWLKDANFNPEDSVMILVLDNLLLITK